MFARRKEQRFGEKEGDKKNDRTFRSGVLKLQFDELLEQLSMRKRRKCTLKLFRIETEFGNSS